MSSDPDREAQEAKQAQWLGEVRPEDMETRELVDPYATRDMTPADEVKIHATHVIHQRGSTQINTMLLVGVCLVILSTIIQIFRAPSMSPPPAAINATASPVVKQKKTTKKRKAPKTKSLDEMAEPLGLPDVVSAVASNRSGRVFVQVELQNSNDVPTEIGTVRLIMLPPGSKLMTVEGPCRNIPPGRTVELELPTPFESEVEFSEEFRSFPLSADVRVEFEVEMTEMTQR